MKMFLIKVSLILYGKVVKSYTYLFNPFLEHYLRSSPSVVVICMIANRCTTAQEVINILDIEYGEKITEEQLRLVLGEGRYQGLITISHLLSLFGYNVWVVIVSALIVCVLVIGILVYLFKKIRNTFRRNKGFEKKSGEEERIDVRIRLIVLIINFFICTFVIYPYLIK